MNMSLSDRAKALWAKSDREKGDGSWHPLIAHLLDVAASAEAILEREPERTRRLYAQDFGFSCYADARPWLLALIALHDLGKASPTFQALWPEGAKRVKNQGLRFKKDFQHISYVPHGIISQIALCESEPLQQALAYDLLRLAADAVGCHHGLRASPTTLNVSDTELGSGVWVEVRNELIGVILALFGADPQKPPCLEILSAAAFYRLAGLTSFADWIGSSQGFFPFEEQVGDLSDYYRRSLDKARKALDAIGWRSREPLSQTKLDFSQIAFDGDGKTYAPRPLQQAVVELLEEASEPTLLLIEAPMGEGKTEAAFYAHVRLQQTLGHRGMYVALPTQATGNALFKRTVGFLQGMGRNEPVDLQLLHGATLLNDDYAKLKIKAVDEREKPDYKHSVSAQEWFSHKKRALLSEYGVGTVDQALLSVLPIKHYFVRMWGLGNRTVVIDEVHAYDTYTSSLIETLLAWLYALGSSAVVMSATLPKTRREALLRAYGAREIPQVEYPRVYKVVGGKVEARRFEADPERRIRLELRRCKAEIADVVPQILASVENGGCVACVVNTVDRAQQIYLALESQARAQGIALYLFHARYPAQQRQEIEDQILGLFGKKGQRPARAILIGTQVLEQSLDLDFDQMFTDLAPIDLVLQRAGRVWRHRRSNRAVGQTQPILHVMGLDVPTDVPNLRELATGEGLYWDMVYDLDILLRTFAVLKGRSHLELPADIDPLVEAVYVPEPPPGTPEALAEAIRQAVRVREEKAAQAQSQAAQTIIGLPQDGSWENVPDLEQYDPDDNPDKHKMLLAATRLGDPSVTVIPLNDLGDGRYRCGNLEFRLEDSLEGSNFWLGRELYKHSLSLSRKDVVLEMWKTERPPSWQKHPLLRNCYPLKLTNGRLRLKYTELELDPVLGVRYHKLSEGGR
jgi:CRISPR-associated endonuclease/helicase Cas3